MTTIDPHLHPTAVSGVGAATDEIVRARTTP